MDKQGTSIVIKYLNHFRTPGGDSRGLSVSEQGTSRVIKYLNHFRTPGGDSRGSVSE